MGALFSFLQGIFPTGQLSVCQYLLYLEHYQWSQTPFHPVTLTEEGGGWAWGVFLLFRALAVLVGLGCSVCGPADGISSSPVDGRGQGPAMDHRESLCRWQTGHWVLLRKWFHGTLARMVPVILGLR